MEREPDCAEARRDDHARVSQTRGDLDAVPAREPGDDDARAPVVLRRRQDLGAEPLDAGPELAGEGEVVREDVLDPEVEQVVDRGRERRAGGVRRRRVLEPPRRARERDGRRVERDRVLGRAPPDEGRVEPLPELGAQVADARPRRRAEPLVAGRDDHVDAEPGGVERDDPGGLRRVEDERRPDGARELDQSGRVEPVARRVLDVAHADDGGALVHDRGDRLEGERRRVVERPRQANLDAGVAGEPEPRVGDAGELEVGGDDVLPLPGLQPPRDLAERLGRVCDHRDVVRPRAEEPRDRRPGNVADSLLDLVVEPDRAAPGDL